MEEVTVQAFTWIYTIPVQREHAASIILLQFAGNTLDNLGTIGL